ncbi:MAG: T9SS type A sorting domain-containing protein [Flavobacteriales bacterium]|nr:T9SS type A sorting domain-containing protein [Flavobacteriales bacterium]
MKRSKKNLHLFSTFFILFLNINNSLGQGCEAQNFKERSDISSTCNEMVVTMLHDRNEKEVLYVANKEAGLKIYDLQNINAPKLMQTIPSDSLGGMDVMNLSQNKNYVFLALGNHFNETQNAGMAIIDVSDPQKAFVSSFWEYQNSPGGAGIVESDDDYAYLGAMKHGMVILDIKDKRNIKFVSVIVPDINYPTPNPNPNLYNARGMELDGNLVYLCYDAGGIRIINVSDKNNPVETGRYSNPALNGKPRAYNNVVYNHPLLYVAVDYCGLEILDITDTSNIVLKGTWNPYNCPANNWFSSPVHANEIHLNKDCDLIYTSVGKSDMMVIDVSDPAKPDSCSNFGGADNSIGTWGIDVFEDKIFLSYICALIPFQSNWTGVKILNYSPCKLNGLAIPDNVLKVFPNPAVNQIKFEGDWIQGTSEIEILDSKGLKMKLGQAIYSDRSLQMNISTLNSGLYFFRIKQNSKILSGKFKVD